MGTPRMQPVLCAALLAIGGLACGPVRDLFTRSQADDAAPTEVADGDVAGGPDKATGSAPQAVRQDAVQRILEAAVHPPPPGGSLYFVDPVVPAYLVERIRGGEVVVEQVLQGPGAPGWRVTTSAGSVIERLGIRPGDVVHTLQGMPIPDIEQVRAALAQAQERITVEVVRDQVSSVLEYRLVGGMAWAKILAELGHDVHAVTASPEAFAEVVERPLQADQSPPSAPTVGTEPTARGVRPSSPPSTRPATRPTPTPSAGSGPRPNTGENRGVRCSSTSECEIDKPYYDAMIAAPERINSQARIVPAIRNDVHSGYKLMDIRRGTAIDQLGFRNGDKITHINGRFMADDAEAMALYLQLSSTRLFRIRYERDGKTLSKTVRVV